MMAKHFIVSSHVEAIPINEKKNYVLVVMAKWSHLLPFRTEKLSTSAPMVLRLQSLGRVGRRQHIVLFLLD